MNAFLNEFRLGEFLNKYLPGNWISNKKFKLTNKLNFRPDYVDYERKIVVEFNGYRILYDCGNFVFKWCKN